MDLKDYFYVSCTDSVLEHLNYTLFLMKPGMNKQVDMNPLMKCIYRSAVS